MRLDFRTKDLGFRVSRFGNKSRHPFGEMDDIPNLIKHWPFAVKTHFPGQHTSPGRIFIYVSMYVFTVLRTYGMVWYGKVR